MTALRNQVKPALMQRKCLTARCFQVTCALEETAMHDRDALSSKVCSEEKELHDSDALSSQACTEAKEMHESDGY